MKIPFRHLAPVVTCLSLCFSPFAEADTPAPNYLAKVSVVLKGSHRDAEEILRKHLPKNDSSITISRVRDTGFFEIGVTAPDANAAAERANKIAVEMSEALAKDKNGNRLVIWEKAEPPARPVAPQQTKK